MTFSKNILMFTLLCAQALAAPTTNGPIALDFLNYEKIPEKPYSLSLDVLRLICVKVNQDPKLKDMAAKQLNGLNENHCRTLLADQSPLLTKDPKYYQELILNNLSENFNTVDYNLSMLEISRIFANAASTILPVKPELVWSSIDELLTALHERNWKMTAELRLDHESRLGTISHHAFQWAKMTALGVFVMRLSHGFLQGLRGTKYLSASLRGASERAGAYTKYFLNKKYGWEKPIFTPKIFEHEGIKYSYSIKTAGGRNTLRIQYINPEDWMIVNQAHTVDQVKSNILKFQERLLKLESEQDILIKKLNSSSPDLIATKAAIASIEKQISSIKGIIASHERALTYGRDAVPEHLSEYVFRREVIGSSLEDLKALAAEKHVILDQYDLEFLSKVRPRSYLDRFLSQEEIKQNVGSKFKSYLLGREALSIYLGAALGGYAGAKYYDRLFERDIATYRDSALQQLGIAYEDALSEIESRIEQDLKSSQDTIDALKLGREDKDFTLIEALVKKEELKGSAEAYSYWAQEAQDLIDDSGNFDSSVDWLEKNYRAPNQSSKQSIDTGARELAGILFNPKRVKGLHDQLIRNAQQIVKLSLELSSQPR